MHIIQTSYRLKSELPWLLLSGWLRVKINGATGLPTYGLLLFSSNICPNKNVAPVRVTAF